MQKTASLRLVLVQTKKVAIIFKKSMDFSPNI